MSRLSNLSKVVWCVQVVRVELDDKETIITDWQEFSNEELATQEASSQVEYYISSTNLHHYAEIVKRVVPIYI